MLSGRISLAANKRAVGERSRLRVITVMKALTAQGGIISPSKAVSEVCNVTKNVKSQQNLHVYYMG